MRQPEMPPPGEHTPEPTPEQIERARDRESSPPARPHPEQPAAGRDDAPPSRERLRSPDSPWMGGG